MAQIDLQIVIDAPPQEVAPFFVPQRMPYWYGAEFHAEFELAGGASDFAAGQKVRISGRAAGREVSLTAVIIKYEWGRLLEWQFQDAYGVRGLQRWRIEARGPATLVAMRDSYELPGRFGRMFDWLITRRAVRHRDAQSLERLTRLATRK
jgi:hypothetical protein